MWTSTISHFGIHFGRLIKKGFWRWMEMLGENPPLSRDHGLAAWQHLHALRAPKEAARPRLVVLAGGLTTNRPAEQPPGWVPPRPVSVKTAHAR